MEFLSKTGSTAKDLGVEEEVEEKGGRSGGGLFTDVTKLLGGGR